MSHTEQIFDRFISRQGWNRDTQLELALRYIEDQQSPDGWEDFLTGIAETENAEDGIAADEPKEEGSLLDKEAEDLGWAPFDTNTTDSQEG